MWVASLPRREERFHTPQDYEAVPVRPKRLLPKSPVVEARLAVLSDLVVEPPHGRSHVDLRAVRLFVEVVHPAGDLLHVDGCHTVLSFPVLQPEIVSDPERPEQGTEAEDRL